MFLVEFWILHSHRESVAGRVANVKSTPLAPSCLAIQRINPSTLGSSTPVVVSVAYWALFGQGAMSDLESVAPHESRHLPAQLIYELMRLNENPARAASRSLRGAEATKQSTLACCTMDCF